MIQTIFSSLLLLLTGSVVLAGPGTDSVAVAQAVESLRKAMIDADKVALDRLTADQLSYGHSGGSIETKAAFIEAIVSGVSDFQTIDLTEQTIMITDKTAMVRHHLVAVTANRGVPGQANLSVLLIWIKQGNTWKLLARQAVKR